MGKPTDLKNKYKMKLVIKDEETGVKRNLEYSIAGMTPMATGGITIDHIDQDGNLESNLYPSGSWSELKIIGDPPPPVRHDRRKEDQEKLKAAMLAAKKNVDADSSAKKTMTRDNPQPAGK